METYSEFFRRVCGRAAFPYQEWFQEDQSKYRILAVPTGMGKTDAVLCDWLYRKPTTRLVYCLPGRALTKQIFDVAKARSEIACPDIQVLELMGGSEDLDLQLGPHEPAILIGTQDILISRALNRGYARSPFRWPIDFALLNNDASWIFDEVQLLGDSLATGAQLAGLRDRFQTFGETPTVWMSATLDARWLHTPDFSAKLSVTELTEEDFEIDLLRNRYEATKILAKAEGCDTPKELAQFAAAEHKDGTLTLLIVNRVERAQETWDELVKLGVKSPLLLHSRFRPDDRSRSADKLKQGLTGIVVSTQVVEAGIDIDADLMVTDVAPWSSLVQRFGRVNRAGRPIEAKIFWIERPLKSKGKFKDDEEMYRPYAVADVELALGRLRELQSAEPKVLGKVKGAAPYRYVLRRSDLLDLFDTTPDLAGNHIDVSRFVRSGEETNVYIAWRSWPNEAPEDLTLFADRELCPVGRSKELDALITKHNAYTWDFVGRGRWKRMTDPRQIYAGMRLLLHSKAGGYASDRGWSPDVRAAVEPVESNAAPEAEGTDSDPRSLGAVQSIAEHTDDVMAELQSILRTLTIDLQGCESVLETAARYHDWGKAHKVFQQTLQDLDEPSETALLAKQKPGVARRKHGRKWFRHELGSALAMVEADMSDLAAYVVAAHHGKVRLNIRSMPGERPGPMKERVARGILEGDTLLAASLGDGVATPLTTLLLGVTELGAVEQQKRAWSDRVLDLLDQWGPFRLAFLEAVLRTADVNASRKANEREGVAND